MCLLGGERNRYVERTLCRVAVKADVSEPVHLNTSVSMTSTMASIASGLSVCVCACVCLALSMYACVQLTEAGV